MSYKSRLKDIKAFVFDVDGVFTDGSVFLLPDGSMCRVMNVLDGYAVVKAIKNNYKIGVITGGADEMVKNRLHYLGITDYYPKSPDKRADLEHFKQKYNMHKADILCMGDDVSDLCILEEACISACPINAVADVKLKVDYISPVPGGKGAVRDVIEQVMKIQGTWVIDDTQSV